jgi:hypothetical protein
MFPLISAATVKFLLSKGANKKLKLSAAAGPHAGKIPLDLVEPTNTEIRAARESPPWMPASIKRLFTPECASLRGASPITTDFLFCVFAVGDNLAEETQLGEEILSRDYAKK